MRHIVIPSLIKSRGQRRTSLTQPFYKLRSPFRSLVAILLVAAFSLNASEYHGVVRFGGLPVPGATVTAEKGDQTMTAVTDAQGVYTFPDLADGAWNLRVEMLGFGVTKQEVTVAPNAPAADLELKMLPFSEMHADVKAVAQPTVSQAATPETPSPAKPAPAKPGAFQRTEVNATGAKEPPAAPGTDVAAAPATSELSQRAADGFLVNGSVNNGAASPFAQFAAFGNGRRAGRSLYSGGIGFTLDNSALDARQFSFTGQNTPKPAKNNLQGLLLFNGPIKIPHLLKNGPLLTINYQWLRNRNANTFSALMPTQDQRNGVFTNPVLDPLTGMPFPNNLIPQTRISPEARALLGLYPLPNFLGSTQYNYQIPVVVPTHQDSLQARINKQVGRKDQLFGLLAFQSTRSDTPSVFGFLDTTSSLGINSNANWRHSLTPRLYLTLGAQFSRMSIQTIPFFANRQNISGMAGITGNLQDSANWGPPSLNFGSGIASLGDAQYSANHNQTAGVSAEMFYAHRAHNFTYGLDFKRQQTNVLAQQDPRGVFSFTGASTGGSDFGGFSAGHSLTPPPSRSETRTNISATTRPTPTSTTTGECAPALPLTSAFAGSMVLRCRSFKDAW